MKKKFKLEIILILVGLILFFVSMLGFVINACLNQNITLAWILFAIIMIGTLLFISGIILFLIRNKDKIKKYINEITK